MCACRHTVYFNKCIPLNTHWFIRLLIDTDWSRRICTTQCERSRRGLEADSDLKLRLATLTHDRKPKTQSRRSYWCCHRTLFFVPLHIPSPTLQPPQAPWFSLMKLYRKFEIEIEALTEGEGLLYFCIGFFFFSFLTAAVCYLCSGLDRNHRVKKRPYWWATALFSQRWPRRLSLMQLWGLPVVLNVLEATYHMHVNVEASSCS